MTTRRTLLSILACGTTAILSGCGTVLYPDRAYQKRRGNLDPAVVILDGIGLFFFIIPGLVAFAVDFTTGAIYFPDNHTPGDRERTIFDQYNTEVRLDRGQIERIVAMKTGKRINLNDDRMRVAELRGIDQFWPTYHQLSSQPGSWPA